MRYDGRDIFEHAPWSTQEEFEVGYHYYMKPEDCVRGINFLEEKKFTEQVDRYYDYPDCRSIKIK